MKLIRPGDQPAERGTVPRASSAFERAQQAAIERSLSRYIPLECTHVITVEDNVFWSFGRPSADTIWCDKCGDWKHAVKPEKTSELPDKPLF